MKKILAALLCLLLICTAAQAAGVPEKITSGDYKYIVQEDGTAQIVGAAEHSIKIAHIPAQIDGYTVTSIGEDAFNNKSYLADITIPETVTHIGAYAFGNTAITSIEIPNTVTQVDGNPFAGCDELVEVKIAPDHPALKLVDGVLFDKRSETLLFYPACFEATSYAIPEGTAAIGEGAFDFCQKLEQIEIPDSVQYIGQMAFYRCFSLQEIAIPEGVTQIKRLTFHQCSKLTSVSFPSTLRAIGSNAFGFCMSFADFVIPEGVTFVDNEAFYRCENMVSVTIPNSLTELGPNPFAECVSLTQINVSPEHPNLYVENGVLFDRATGTLVCYPSTLTAESYAIPEGTLVIGASSFEGHSPLKSVSIPQGVTEIGDSAFRNCHSLSELSIPDSVTRIGNYAFSSTALKKLVIGPSVTEIGSSFLWDCEQLEKVAIPASVTEIGQYAFTALEDVEFYVQKGSQAEQLIAEAGLSYQYYD